MILINGQWQGGADIETLYGAKEIEKMYLSDQECRHAEISEDTDLVMEDLIIGNQIIKEQTRSTFELLNITSPLKLFTIGGGCDADIASLAYMNQKYNGDLTVVWFDAHGDINSPEESESHLFFGMPLRMLLGNEHFSDIIETPLYAGQVINVGGRDLDASEIEYMQVYGIPVISSDKIEEVIPQIVSRGHQKIYIHLDLDCLEPSDFSSTPLPVPGGIRVSQLEKLLKHMKADFDIVGMGLYEYKPCANRNIILEQLVNFGASL